MNLLIKREKLELLLEKNKERIGHSHIEGTDALISGITFGISTMFASYQDIGPFSEPIIKTICFVLCIIFAGRGVYMMVRSRNQKYGHQALLKDIENLNEITHPFSIVVIKDTFREYSNQFLLYYDSRWDCRFFINYRTAQDGNEESIKKRLSNDLNIPVDQITLQFKEQRIQQKYSFSSGRNKCYEHKLYYAEISFTDRLKRKSFEIAGKKYFWMTIPDMEKDDEIKEKNMDVVNFVREVII